VDDPTELPGYRTEVREIDPPEAEAAAREILAKNSIPTTAPRGLTNWEMDAAKTLATLDRQQGNKNDTQ